MMKKIFCFSIILITFANTTFAQPGAIDSSFNYGNSFNGYIIAHRIQNDGKIIVGGNFNQYNGSPCNNIARINNDGSRDTTFNIGTGTNNDILSISIQNDNKSIICGMFTTYNGVFRKHIARLNENGSLDTLFNPINGTNGYIQASCIQNDQKILIGGNFNFYNTTRRQGIARLNIDGSLDLSFNPDTAIFYDVYGIAIQNDGKILVGGSFTDFNGYPVKNILRLNSDGTIDSTFNPVIGADDRINIVLIQNDGKIVIGGVFEEYNGSTSHYLTRINADGSLDLNFNNAIGLSWEVNAGIIQPDGRIIVGGYFDNFSTISTNHIARINTDGTLDATFNSGNGTDAAILSISLQNDGKIIIGGGFTNYNGTPIKDIARINNNTFAGLRNESNNESTYKIYPNPCDGVISLESKDLINGEIKVYSYAGKLVLSVKITDINKMNIDLSDQSNGLYILEIIQKSNSKRFKISKQ